MALRIALHWYENEARVMGTPISLKYQASGKYRSVAYKKACISLETLILVSSLRYL